MAIPKRAKPAQPLYDPEIIVPARLKAHRVAMAIANAVRPLVFDGYQDYHLKITLEPLSYNAANWLYPGMIYYRGMSQAFDYPLRYQGKEDTRRIYHTASLAGRAAMLTADCMALTQLKLANLSGTNDPRLFTADYHVGNRMQAFTDGSCLSHPEYGFLHQPGAISLLVTAGPLHAPFLRLYLALAGNNQQKCQEALNRLTEEIDNILQRYGGDLHVEAETF